MTRVSSSGCTCVAFSYSPMTKPPATQTTSGYSAQPKGPLAIQGATLSNAPPSILGSVSHTNEMPCSMSRKNSHTNAPAIAPVSATQARNIRRLSGFVSFDADTGTSKGGAQGLAGRTRCIAAQELLGEQRAWRPQTHHALYDGLLAVFFGNLSRIWTIVLQVTKLNRVPTLGRNIEAAPSSASCAAALGWVK